jgi:DtxR family Mn-dependent transcriptional regulator
MIQWLTISALAVFGLLLCWPSVGLVHRWRQMRETAARVLREDALKHVYKTQVDGRPPTLESIAGTLHIHSNQAAGLMADMERRGLVTFCSGELQLTPTGREAALHIIRAHRLWERFLADQTAVAESEWHGQAEDREHHLSAEHVRALSAQLGHPTHDPHGDTIPQASGPLAADNGQPLNVLSPNHAARITHIEDEPEAVYAQIAAEGLCPGMKVRVLEKSPQAIRFWADGDEHVLAPILAHNIAVIPISDIEIEEELESLSSLKPGQKARIVELSRACRGAERRRLLDLGFVPGSKVEVEMVSPIGDPTAYRIRGAVIALRREQAALIRVAILQPVSV